METTKIIVEISEKNAIMAGSKIYGCVLIDYDPAALTEKQRETISNLGTRDGYCVDNQRYNNVYFRNIDTREGIVTADTLPKILDEYAENKEREAREKAEKEKAEKERYEFDRDRKVRQYLSLADEDLSQKINRAGNNHDDYYRGRWYIDGESKNVYNDNRLAEKLDRAINIVENKKIEKEKQKKEKAAEKTRLNEEAKQQTERKKAQIATWIAENGTDNQKKRLSVNLLSDEEIINAIRDEAFEPIDNSSHYADRYEKLKSSDVNCFCGAYDEKNVIFDVKDAATATEGQFNLMEMLKSYIPEAEITLREHTAYCERCNDDDDADDGEIKRFSLKVGLTVGEFYFTREYAT